MDNHGQSPCHFAGVGGGVGGGRDLLAKKIGKKIFFGRNWVRKPYTATSMWWLLEISTLWKANGCIFKIL